jgi:hypothetical protein
MFLKVIRNGSRYESRADRQDAIDSGTGANFSNVDVLNGLGYTPQAITDMAALTL